MNGRVGIELAAVLAAVGLLAGACQREPREPRAAGQPQQQGQPGQKAQPVEAPAAAVAVLHPTAGNQTAGTVRFSRTAGGIAIEVDISGLASGKHGFHIHTWGDCSAPDATSAGGHFNPEGQAHGAPGAEKRHVGDLGNLEAGADGRVAVKLTDDVIALDGEHGIVGRALIVHADRDDFTSQPTGAAGARVACGVIGLDRPEAQSGHAAGKTAGTKAAAAAAE